LVIVTETFWITIVDDLLDGRLTGRPDGVINDAVNIKKINNKKMISVIEDILNNGLILLLAFKFIF
jgi:hypothetical protein